MITAPRSSNEEIHDWCYRLGEAFGKRVTDGLVSIWQKKMGMFEPWLLKKSFNFIESEDEKFPSVARCLKVCRENAPYQSDYQFTDKKRYEETVDAVGAPCIRDKEKRELLYRAKDCPEGREFLAMLRKVAGKMELPK